jgi:TolA-binding protein
VADEQRTEVMMTCARYGGTETAERYVTGAMTEDEQAAFEEHFFECDTCLAEVRLLQDLQTTLPAAVGAAPATLEQPALPPERQGRGWLTGLATAAVLTLAGALWFWMGDARRPAPATPVASAPPATSAPGAEVPATETPAPSGTASIPRELPAPPPATASPTGERAAVQPRTPAASAESAPDAVLDELAMVTPPPYFPLPTRGEAGRDRSDFDTAMGHYVAGRYAEAVSGLAPLVERAPDLVHAQFFLGVSELAIGQTSTGRSTLQRVVQTGIPPFADEAHFYLAKAALADRRLDVAIDELTKAMELDAGPEGEAARLLARVRTLQR